MTDQLLGQVAALGAGMVFSITSTLFALVGRKYHSLYVMQIYLPMAAISLIVIHYIANGYLFPSDAGIRWVYLGASGILGYGFTMWFLINAYGQIGPRLTQLVASIKPIISAIFAFFIFNQSLGLQALIGMALTLIGIAWVILNKGEMGQHKNLRLGIFFATMSALAQAAGYIFSTEGLKDDFNPISAAVIRITVATCVVWPLLTLGRRNQPSSTINKRHLIYIAIGTLTGPILGALLMLTALQNASVGVASTLFNTTPIFLIPIGYVVFKERITISTILGTLVAFGGIAIFFL